MKYEMVTLDELVSIKGGGTPSKDKAEYWNGNIPWASVKDLTSLWLSSTIDHISEEGLRNSSANLIKAGTIIIPTRMALGKVSINTIDVAINQDLKALSIKNNKTTSINYLKYFLISKADEIEKNGKGATVKGITIDVIKNLRIPLPPLPEQTRIAAILDQADKIRQKRRRAAALADEFLRSVFLEMFGDPVSNPKGWKVGTIRDLVATANYGTSAKASETDGAYPILRMGNLTYSGQMDFSDLKYIDLARNEEDKYLVCNGDLLFNRTNSKELVGKTAVFNAESPMAYAGYLVRIRCNSKGNEYYLSGYLNSEHGKKTLQSMCKSIVGMANINAQELQNIQILLPPKSLQDKYAQIVVSTQERLEKYKHSENSLNNLFQSLSQQFFNPT